MRSALGLCLLLALASCDSFASRFQCQRDAQCVRPSMTGGAGEAGLCLASSCAFPAPECPVLLRYDVSASPERVGQCVSPAPSDPRFRPVVDPDGALVLPPLTLWFPGPSPQNAAAGRVGAAYLSTFDRESRGGSAAGDPAMGTSRLYRLDPERANLTELTSPEPGAALRLGVSSPVGLFVASASRLYYSPDGLRFTTRAPLALQGLAHDGELLYLLADGGLFATTGDEESLIPIPRPGAAGERVVGLLGGLSGAGPVLALTRQTGADGVSTTTTAYRRENNGWVKIHSAPGVYEVGALPPAGGVILAGSIGVSTSAGVASVPGLPALPESRLYALSHPTGKDLQWSLWTGVGAPQRRERATDPWTATPVDPLASDVAALDREVGPGARGLLTLTGADGAPVLLLDSRVSVGGAAQSRLFLGRGAL